MAVTRRDFLRSATAISVGALAGVGAYGVAYERHHLSLLELDLPVRGLPPALNGVRVGMITDIHHSAVVSADDVARAVTMVKNSSPDMVVLGGGLVEAIPGLIRREVRKSIDAHAAKKAARSVKVVTAKLHRHAGTVGAARLALDMLNGSRPFFTPS